MSIGFTARFMGWTLIHCCRTCLMSWIPRHRRDHRSGWCFGSWEAECLPTKVCYDGKNLRISWWYFRERNQHDLGGVFARSKGCYANDYYSWNVEDLYCVSGSSNLGLVTYVFPHEKWQKTMVQKSPKQPPFGCKKRPFFQERIKKGIDYQPQLVSLPDFWLPSNSLPRHFELQDSPVPSVPPLVSSSLPTHGLPAWLQVGGRK